MLAENKEVFGEINEEYLAAKRELIKILRLKKAAWKQWKAGMIDQDTYFRKFAKLTKEELDVMSWC